MDQHSDLAVVSGQLPIAHQDQNTKTDGNVPRHRLRPAVLRLSWFGGKVGGQWTLPTTLSTSPTTAPVFPYAPDLPSLWAGLSHGAIIIPVNGELILITESPAIRRDIVSVQDVRSADGFVPDKVAATLREMGLGNSRVGLVAGVASVYKRLLNSAKRVDFIELDYVIEALRRHKSEFEFELLREAAVIGNASMEAMMKSASTPGTSEADAVAEAYNVAMTFDGHRRRISQLNSLIMRNA